MERILETEYMDTAEEASSYAAMPNETNNIAVTEFFLEAGGGQGVTLDIGTGPGDIPILIAQRAEAARIVAVDAAEHMLRVARERVANAGFAERITLQRCDAKALPFGDHSFDNVISNTILHHIPEPLFFLKEAARVRKPGGVLVIRDLYRPETEEQAHELVRLHASTATDDQQKMLFDSLHAGLTLDEARAMVAEVGMTGASVEMTSDRHYTIVWK